MRSIMMKETCKVDSKQAEDFAVERETLLEYQTEDLKIICDTEDTLEYERSIERLAENYRMLAPDGLSENEYYSRFVKGLWVVPNSLDELLVKAEIAAKQARFEFGEAPTIS